MSSILDRPITSPTFLTHMPFLTRHDQQAIVVFGHSHEPSVRVPHYGRTRVGRLWKLWICQRSAETLTRDGIDLRESKPVATGLEPNEVECSPCLSLTDGEVHLSFIGTIGHGTGPLRHRLYRMSGPRLSRLSAARLVSDRHCYCGFWRPDLTTTGDGDGRVRMAFATGEQRELDTGFARIARISYRADVPHHLLITGGDEQRADTAMRTLVYDLKSEQVAGEILNEGQPTYKPAIYGSLALLPQQVAAVDRGWQLSVSTRPQLATSNRRFHRLP